jgi:DNA repair exonuclease SbcCD ATPase subunit
MDSREDQIKRASISHYRIENTSNVDTESAIKELVDQANLAEDAVAEIERLRAENAWLKSDREFQSEEQAARIKELEAQCEDLMQNCNSLRERAWKAEVRIKEQDDALVEERTGAIRCESYDHCEGMYRIDLPDAMIRAQQELQAEGKIGPDAKPRSWQITEERKAAIERLIIPVEILLVDHETDPEIEDAVRLLRGMLEGAGQ